ncbi:MAG: hypothetical protein V2J02_06890 [Pseudomonadales bacterium]|jgi:hypothetical protein|nr:hypothetical protein [Pseudomonadales bacterium]
MSLFEFLMVFVSIIVGLGVTEALSGIARQIRFRDASGAYWVHSCLVALVLLALVQNWWELWQLRELSQWGFSSLLFMLVPPASMYLIAHLLFPDPVRGSDFRAYYFGPMRPVWWLAVLAATSSTLFRPLAFGSDLVSLDNVSAALMVVGFVTLGVSRNPWLHAIAVPAFLGLLLWDVLYWVPVIGTS